MTCPHIQEAFRGHNFKMLIDDSCTSTAVLKTGQAANGDDFFIKVSIDKRTGNFSVSTNQGIVSNEKVLGYHSIPVHDAVVVDKFIVGIKALKVCPGLVDSGGTGDHFTSRYSPDCQLLLPCSKSKRNCCLPCFRLIRKKCSENGRSQGKDDDSEECSMGTPITDEGLDNGSGTDTETYSISDIENGETIAADSSQSEEATSQMVTPFDIDIRSSILYDQLQNDILSDDGPSPGQVAVELPDLRALASAAEMFQEHGKKAQLAYKCSHCRERFRSQRTVLHHMASHTRGNICGICQRSFPKQLLDTHLLTHISIKQHTCSECGKKYQRKVKLRAHRMLHKMRKTHICGLCGKQYVVRKNYLLHMESRHQQKSGLALKSSWRRPLGCCKMFQSPQQMKLHALSHYKETFLCKDCPSKFSQKHSLVIHRVKHLNYKPFKCTKCRKTFKYCYLWEGHLLRCHGAMQMQCNKCPRSFLSQQSLRIHSATIHGKHEMTDKGRKSISGLTLLQWSQTAKSKGTCPVCGENVRNNIRLRMHLLRHRKCMSQWTSWQKSTMLKDSILMTKFPSHSGSNNGEKVNQRQKKLRRGKFRCETCPETFTNRIQLRRHRQSHSKGKSGVRSKSKIKKKKDRMSCSICGKLFWQIGQLRKHELTHLEMPEGDTAQGKKERQAKPKERSFMCDLCGKTFLYKTHLNEHTSSHTGEKPYACDLCPKKFYRRARLIIHKRRHTGERPFSCEVCQMSFHMHSILIEHCRRHHDTLPYYCSACGKGFLKKWRLKEHLNIHNNSRPYECDICKRTFHVKDSLSRHIKTKHKDKEFLCEICSKEFAYKREYLKHMRRIHGDGTEVAKEVKESLVCAVCGKTYSSKHNLQRHESLHTDPKPFKCTLCDKAFSEKRYLLNHAVSHSGQSAYQCSVCHKGFTMKSHLVTHMKSHSSVKPYQCMECSKSFTLKHTLEKHLWTHRDYKPFRCDFCDRQFIKQHLFNKHLMEHAGQQRLDTSSYQELTPVMPGLDAAQWTNSVSVIPVPTMDIMNWSQTHPN